MTQQREGISRIVNWPRALPAWAARLQRQRPGCPGGPVRRPPGGLAGTGPSEPEIRAAVTVPPHAEPCTRNDNFSWHNVRATTTCKITNPQVARGSARSLVTLSMHNWVGSVRAICAHLGGRKPVAGIDRYCGLPGPAGGFGGSGFEQRQERESG